MLAEKFAGIGNYQTTMMTMMMVVVVVCCALCTVLLVHLLKCYMHLNFSFEKFAVTSEPWIIFNGNAFNLIPTIAFDRKIYILFSSLSLFAVYIFGISQLSHENLRRQNTFGNKSILKSNWKNLHLSQQANTNKKAFYPTYDAHGFYFLCWSDQTIEN